MKVRTILTGMMLAGSAAGVAGAQSYMPFGPQTNVNIATVLGGGWSMCYVATMMVPIGDRAEGPLGACTGTNLMMAGRRTGDANLLVLAAGPRAAVTTPVGTGANAHHLVNGAEWYYEDSWSWGFAPAGATTRRTECDTYDPADPARMCLHTFSWVGGWRIGTYTGLNGSADFEKVFFQGNGQGVIPEPSTYVLVASGLLGVFGVARRRRNS